MVLPTAGVAQAKERADRSQWQQRLGRQGVIDLDRRTGTPRVLARLDGTLTGASSRSPEAIATAYVRANLGHARPDRRRRGLDARRRSSSPAA